VLNADTGGFVPLGNDKPKGRWPTASRDGRQMFYVGSDGIVARDMTSGAQQLVGTDRISGGIQTIALSPDGQWLAVRSGLNGIGKLSIIPSTGGELRPLSAVLNSWSLVGLAIEWSPDGRFVYVVKKSEPKAGETLSEIWRIPADGGAPQDTGITWAGAIGRISANPDGRRLAISTNGGSTEIWALQNIPPQKIK
jgi:dipeptidyl aminopeptidase/acylaminoacyl peptidase